MSQSGPYAAPSFSTYFSHSLHIGIMKVFTALCLATVALANPLVFSRVANATGPACDTSGLDVPLPANQTKLQVPAGEEPVLVTIGRGVQNYTCHSGKWASAGALAKYVH